MTEYETIRERVRSGDLVLVKGRGIFSRLVRLATAETFSHVGVLVRMNGGIWVAEMSAPEGFKISPASQWVETTSKRASVFWGAAPAVVSGCGDDLVDAVMRYRATAPDYSYWTLFSVWVAQLVRKKTPASLVCSTLVQRIWERCGMQFIWTPDPADFALFCKTLTPLVGVDPSKRTAK